jgi:hypothetical protein
VLNRKLNILPVLLFLFVGILPLNAKAASGGDFSFIMPTSGSFGQTVGLFKPAGVSSTNWTCSVSSSISNIVVADNYNTLQTCRLTRVPSGNLPVTTYTGTYSATNGSTGITYTGVISLYPTSAPSPQDFYVNQADPDGIIGNIQYTTQHPNPVLINNDPNFSDSPFLLDGADGAVLIKNMPKTGFTPDEQYTTPAHLGGTLPLVVRVFVTPYIEPFVFPEQTDSYITENPANSYKLKNVIPASGGSGPITYSVTSTPANAVKLENSPLGILINDPSIFDYEVRTSVPVSITATSGSESITRTFTIFIDDDVSDNPVIYTPAPINASVNENPASGASIYGMPKVDSRGTPIIYSFPAGIPGNSLTLNGDSILIAADPSYFDREQRSVIQFPYETDNGDSTGSSTITININDVDEFAPVIQSTSFTVSESAQNGSVIGTLQASDADATSSLRYQILDASGWPKDAVAVSLTTGVLTVKNSSLLDYNTNPTFVLKVRVLSGSKTVDKDITINVTSFNDGGPSAGSGSYSINENPAMNAIIGTVTITDPDGVSGVYINYISGNVQNAISISNDGSIRVNNPAVFDAESTQSIVVTYVATDGQYEDQGVVTIVVNDVDEFNPVAPDVTYTVSETAANGTPLGNLNATDADVTAQIKYSLTGGNGLSAFKVNTNTGVLTILDSSKIDFETNPTLIVNYLATSGSKSNSGVITVNVTNENDSAPQANSPTFTINENPVINSVLGTLTVTDGDGDSNHVYSITTGNVGDAIRIEHTPGSAARIIVNSVAAFNREARQALNISYKVTDGTANSTGVIKINLNDVNEFTPYIADKTFSVSEGVQSGFSIGQTLGLDEDATATVTHTIVAGQGIPSAVSVNSVTGALTVADPSVFDYEARTSFTFKVRASDGQNQSEATVTINITDVNDGFPTAGDVVINLNENPGIGSTIGQAPISDPDGNNTLSLAITGGNINNAVAIDTNGNVTVANPAPFNAEQRNKIVVSYSVTDGDGTATGLVTINIADVDEFAPTMPEKTFPLFENSVAGTLVGQMETFDQDVTQTPMTFSITSGNTGSWKGLFQGNVVPFAINSTTGRITVLDPTDFRKANYRSYELGIRATGGGRTINSKAFIDISDINASAPQIQDANYTIAENTANGTAVGTMVGSDVDGDAISYSILNGNTGNAFSINPTSGVISVSNRNALDREVIEKFTLTIQGTDGGFTTNATVVINLNDVNEFPPVTENKEFSVNENAPNGSVVGVVPATDADITAQLTYSITAGNDGTYQFPSGNRQVFAINPSTGQLTVNDNFDLNYESHPAPYVLTVRVTDGVNNSNSIITVNIVDVNESIPVGQNRTFTINEHIANGSTVGTATATDGDALQSLTYSIVGGNPNNAFAINPDAGVITVSNSPAVDREETDKFVLSIQASDGFSSGNYTATVNLNDVDEFDIISVDHTVEMFESEPNGFEVAIVDAQDNDATAVLSYAITGGNTSNAFAINSSTGAIRVNNTNVIDDKTTPQYELLIRITSGSKTKVVKYTIVILTVNLNDPVVSNITLDLNENSPNGTNVGSLAGTDGDGDPLTYSINSGNELGVFQLNPTTGVLQVADNTSLNREAPLEKIIIGYQASDGERIGIASATINIIDVNEFIPVVDDKTLSVNENSPKGTLVGVVDAVDNDATATLVYSITGGNDGTFDFGCFCTPKRFSINPSNGEIRIDDPSFFDAETNNQFVITVSVSDGLNTDTAEITVLVADVDEFPAVMEDQVISINENEPDGTPVTTVTVDDQDVSSNPVYRIVSGNLGNTFAIDDITGLITVSRSSQLDAEKYSRFILLIGAADDVNVSTSTVTIEVVDVNEFSPEAIDQTITINENPSASYVLGNMNAADEDRDAVLQYSILADSSINGVQINSLTGELVVANPAVFDRELTEQIVLSLQVSDGLFTKVASFTVNLGDVNEFPPVMADELFQIDEDKSINTVVGTMTVVDGDATASDTIAFQILSGNQDGYFKIHPNTGVISVASRMDAEAVQNVTLTVQASDGQLSSTATVLIEILDVNEFPPALQPQDGLLVVENSPIGTQITTIVATDPDLSSIITFTISSGNAKGIFGIDPSTGALTVLDPTFLNAEDKQSHTLTIKASDGVKSDTQAYAIEVVDENEFAPEFQQPLSFSIDENSPNGTPVDSVVAIDQDITGTISYSISGGNGATAFDITAEGLIFVEDTTLLDRETFDALYIDVIATDGTLSTTQQIAINLIDINEFAPSIATFDSTVDENLPVGTEIGYVTGIDDDATAVLTYRIASGNNDSVFALDEATGLLTVRNSSRLDAETYEFLTLDIIVSDGVNEAQDVINIIINDVNEFAPRFTVTKLELSEDATQGFEVGVAEAIDDDREGVVSFAVTGGTGQPYFDIHQDTGMVTLEDASTLDAETVKSYKLTVLASDGTFSTVKDILINVLDVNEFTLTAAHAEESFNENLLRGSSLYRPIVEDADTNPQYVYSLSSGNEDNHFVINPKTGLISLAEGKSFDYETKRIYNLVVSVNDQQEITDIPVIFHVKDLIEWSYVYLKPTEDSPVNAWQGRASDPIRLVPKDQIDCTLTTDMATALSDGAAYCLFKFKTIPEGLTDQRDMSASGVFNTVGENLTTWMVGKATPYGEIAWQRDDSFATEVHSTEGPDLILDRVKFAPDGRYVVEVGGRVATLRNRSRADVYVSIVDEEGNHLLEETILRSGSFYYMNIVDEPVWSEKVYTISSRFVEQESLTTELTASVIVINGHKVDGEIEMERLIYDNQDVDVTVKFGEKFGGEYTFIPNRVGNWTGFLATLQGNSVNPITDPFPITNSSHQLTIPAEQLEAIANKNIVAVMDLESPVAGYEERFVTRYARPRIYRGGPVEVTATPIRSEGPTPLSVDIRISGDAYHRSAIGSIVWERSKDGSTFTQLTDKDRSRLTDHVETGTYLYRASITNRYTGVLSYSNEVPIRVFDRIDLNVDGPTYVITGTDTVLQARSIINGVVANDDGLAYEWVYDDADNNTVVIPGPVMMFSGTEPQSVRGRLRARDINSNPDIRSVWTEETFNLTVVDPRPLRAGLRVPIAAEVDKLYNIQPVITTPWRSRPSTGVVKVEWHLPTGEIVSGDAETDLEWTPSQALLDEVGMGNYTNIELHTWIEGFKEQTQAIGVARVKIWKYEWPVFNITERKRYIDAPTDITFEARPDDHNWYRQTYGEEISYEWSLPPGVELLTTRNNQITARVYEGGDYVVAATITDTRGNRSDSTVSFTVGDTPPYTTQVNINPSNRYYRVPYDLSISVRTSGGHRENRITGVQQYVDGVLVEDSLNRSPKISFETPGTYELKTKILTEMDVTSEVTTTVNAFANKLPACTQRGSKGSTSVLIDAVCSDPDGLVRSYRWYLDGVQLSLTSRRVTISLQDLSESGSNVTLVAVDDSDGETTVSEMYFK